MLRMGLLCFGGVHLWGLVSRVDEGMQCQPRRLTIMTGVASAQKEKVDNISQSLWKGGFFVVVGNLNLAFSIRSSLFRVHEN